jgi:hypothetical protein
MMAMRGSCSKCAVVAVARAATTVSYSFLLAAAVAYCSPTEKLEALLDMIGKTVVVLVGIGEP